MSETGSAPETGTAPEGGGLLALRRHLAPATGAVPDTDGWWSGPRWWWAGALDVEGLALGSLGALIAALDALAAADAEAGGAAASGRRVTTSSALAAASFDSIRHLRVDGTPPDIWAPMSGFRRARDGWVRLHANYPHHARRLLEALGLEDPEQLDGAVLERTAHEVEEAVRGAGGVAAAVRTRQEWQESPPGRAAAVEPWIRWSLEDAAGRRPPAAEPGGLPLAGVRVLDLTRVIAGPSATRLLGALGADVLRIDPPQHPELLDAHLDTGFAKRSAVVDLRDPFQLGRIRDLAAAADVVFLGYRQGALARFGLDAAALRESFAHLAVVTLNAWGWDSPWADARGFDSIVQAACGVAHLCGGPGSRPDDGAWRPGALPVQALDHATGMGMAAAAVALLAARGRGIAGTARLSLAATAEELLRADRPAAPAQAVGLPVETRQAHSAYGVLEFVPPPLVLGGTQLEYPNGPLPYGGSALGWAQGAGGVGAVSS
ncbi:L-carnitine dehydratase/bile acid-inducible protein F [Sinomonas atrocyanea]|uniref:L-carnitine dehydratase/bile acid-inducible protein F n=1 Tax=Sinomonas atrocyanea TaxID=37927 RepID=A0A127A446_9MICC|nr:CoA transferase [Sinomonas atrocyanea]AMM33876.1 L-carnitine dehydratase/bile acid-inducible protein F [Sinomonas atrocyanea]GEB66041.1 putative L-carnitine dehydratase [Sinomonas atrocyanea]GGG56784.1 putative L-carnitine dehydratase [Sinomonas atrocyanea]